MNDELIERCKKAARQLTEISENYRKQGNTHEHIRIDGKVEGVLLALSYILEYKHTCPNCGKPMTLICLSACGT